MAVRYLAVLSADAERLSVVQKALCGVLGYSPAWDFPELALFVTPASGGLKCSSDELAVVGTVYSRSGHADPFDWDDGKRPREPGWHAQRLLREVWGGYVAFIRRSQAPAQVEVMRDPSGSLPCYMFQAGPLTCFCSDVDIAIRSGLYRPSIDWTSVVQHLWAVALPQRRTALVGLDEVPQGSRLIWDATGDNLEPCWSPWNHVGQHAARNDAELAEELRAIVEGTIASLASRYRHVQLCLSGGLDSSIVAASLARSGAQTTGLILLSRGVQGDERAYAGLVAKTFGMKLHEGAYRLEYIDLDRSSAEHLPKPVGAVGRQAFDRINNELAAKLGADAQFSGNGGDNVFCFLQSATPIADRLRKEGAREAWSTLSDVCHMTGSSIWTAFRNAVRQMWRNSHAYRWRGQAQFLRPEVIEASGARIHHPWLDAPDDALGGAAAHIALLLRPQSYTEGHPRDGSSELVTPLLAQPVVEFCLGIPSWRWCAGGQDRALARKAFAPSLPASIIDRRSKGGPAGFYHEVVENLGSQLRDRLLGGVLAAHHLLDENLLEEFFRTAEFRRGDEYVRILALADAEAWARCWQQRSSGSVLTVHC